jgi:hypothetical protein
MGETGHGPKVEPGSLQSKVKMRTEPPVVVGEPPTDPAPQWPPEDTPVIHPGDLPTRKLGKR